MKKLDLFLTKKIQAAIPGLVYQSIYTTDNASNSGTSFYIKEITRKRMTSTTLKVFYILIFKHMNYLLSALSQHKKPPSNTLKSTWVVIAIFFTHVLTGQNVGIGTDNPQAKLQVVGTVMATEGLVEDIMRVNGRVGINGPAHISYRLFVNNGHSYFQGNTITTGTATINGVVNAASNVSVGSNLNVANDGIIENNFRVNGRVGINGATNGSYGLMVNNSNSYFQGNTITTGTATIDGILTTGSNLSVGGTLNVANDGIVGNNLRVNGRVGINGPTNANYGLFVNSSNSYFQGNVTATGTVSAAGNLTIKGNGHVRSNGSSNLYIGFTSKYVNMAINNGATAAVSANISPFTGDNNDVRVFVAQVVNDNGDVLWQKVKITVMGVNAADNTCLLWLHNDSGANGVLKGTIYLTTIAKD